MAILNDSEIKVAWDKTIGYEGCYNANDFFEKQFDNLMIECAENDRLPFFEKPSNEAPKSTPVNVLNRNEFTDINKTALELHSSRLGCKSNEYVFGADLVELGLALDTKKDLTPVLTVAKTRYNQLDRTFDGQVDLTKEGLAKQKDFIAKKYSKLRIDCQFMYNVEQLDENSQKRLKRIIEKEYSQYQNKDVERKKENQFNWESNGKDKKEATLKVMNDALSKFNNNIEAKNVCKMLLKHEISQQTGNHNAEYNDTAKVNEAKAMMINYIKDFKEKSQENPNIKSNFMEISYRARIAGSRVVSKDMNFEQKNERTDKIKAMEKSIAIER